MVQFAKIRGLGLRDPGSNPGIPIYVVVNRRLFSMATKSKKTKSSGRFGARYGKTVRNKLTKIEVKQRKKQRCPFCEKLGAKRLSKGIWECSKCNKKFASNTYYLDE